MVGRVRANVHGQRPAPGRVVGRGRVHAAGRRPPGPAGTARRGLGRHAGPVRGRRPPGDPRRRAARPLRHGLVDERRRSVHWLPRDAVWGAGAGDQVVLVVPSLRLIVGPQRRCSRHRRRGEEAPPEGRVRGVPRPAGRGPVQAARRGRHRPGPVPAEPGHHPHRVGPEGRDRPPGEGERQLAAHLGRRRPPVHGLRGRQRVRAVRAGEARGGHRPRRGGPAGRSPGSTSGRHGREHGRGQGRQEGERDADGGRRAILAGPQRRQRPARVVGRPRPDVGVGRLEVHDELRLPDLPELRQGLRRCPGRLRVRVLAGRRHRLPAGRPHGPGPRPEGKDPGPRRLRVLPGPRPRRPADLDAGGRRPRGGVQRTPAGATARASPTTPG